MSTVTTTTFLLMHIIHVQV